VLLLSRLKKAIGRINSSIPADAQHEAIKEIQTDCITGIADQQPTWVLPEPRLRTLM
jgi:hypothetical protein